MGRIKNKFNQLKKMPSEFTLDITPQLQAGLRRFERQRTRQAGLVELKNLRPKSYGLEPIVPVTDYFTSSPTISWPWPQLFRGELKNYLFFETSVEEVTESAGPTATRVAINTFDQTNAAASKNIVAGGVWHFVDLKDAFYAFNGSCVVFDPGIEKLHGLANKVYVQDTVSIETGCHHQGRVVFGGFDSSNIWSNWSSILAAWDTAETDVTTPRDDVGENYVMWSSIGGGDFPLWLFYPVNANYTYDLDKSADRILDLLRRNELGWMPMPFSGKVLRVAPLGKHVIVYGEDGIAAMTAFTPNLGYRMPPTYGRASLLPLGVASRGSVAVGKTRHVFLTSQGELYTITPDLQLQRLGYKEYFSPLLSEKHNFFPNESEEEFYLSGQTDQYILTSTGLCKHTQTVTSAYLVEDTLVGPSETITDDDGFILTLPFDLERPGRKRITSIDLYGHIVGQVEVSIEYKRVQGDSFTRLGFQRVNPHGSTRLQATGVEFRIAVRASTYSNLKLDGLRVTYQLVDRRFVRGPSPLETRLGT